MVDAGILEILDDVATGQADYLNTQAPLTLPGMLSTAPHPDVSRVTRAAAWRREDADTPRTTRS